MNDKTRELSIMLFKETYKIDGKLNIQNGLLCLSIASKVIMINKMSSLKKIEYLE